MDKKRFPVLLFLLGLLFLFPQYSLSTEASEADSEPSKKAETLSVQTILNYLSGLKGYREVPPDTRLEILNALIEVHSPVQKNRLSAEAFYQKVTKLPLPKGMELRHLLMEIKSDVGRHWGDDGLRMVLGEQYAEGGSFVEQTLLEHRKKIVLEARDAAIKKLAAENPKFSIYYSEVGSWATENPKQLQFAGDIDFNFLSGDLETARALKATFDNEVKQRYNLTPEELDIPCTVHGDATGEVYVGRHGQSYAEEVTKKVREISFGENGKPIGVLPGEVDFDDARNIMLLEAEVSKTPLADLDELKWPQQPGLTLEMLRHFEHDIAGKNVYSDLESFVKAAKYLDRHFASVLKESGEGAIKNKKLRDFAKRLVEQKHSPRNQVDLIETYFNETGKTLPFEVELGKTISGKSERTMAANEKVISDFWDQCRTTMWESANRKINTLTADFARRSAVLGENDVDAARALYEEMSKYQQMLEVENAILNDDQAGIAKRYLDADYVKQIDMFRTSLKSAKQQMAKQGLFKEIDPPKQGIYEFSQGLAKKMSTSGKHMLAAALALPGESYQAASDFNDILDFVDDRVMNKIRYGETQTYASLLGKKEQLYWGKKADAFLKGTRFEGRYSSGLDSLNQRYNDVNVQLNKQIAGSNAWLNNTLKQNCIGRGVKLIGGSTLGAMQDFNNSYNRSISSSTAGQAAMKGMMIYSLSQEMPVYIDALANGDWQKMGTELFERRVPLGGAVKNYVMGNYYGVAWEVTATLLPPLTMLSVANSIANTAANSYWEYSWSEELETYIDELYDDAEFKVVGVETTGDNIKISQWELLAFNRHGQRFPFNALYQLKIEAAKESKQCFDKAFKQLKGAEREQQIADNTAKESAIDRYIDCKPHEKIYDDFFDPHADTVLMQNLGKTDPFIKLIEELAANPHVGKKLDSRYYYQKEVRFEEVKAAFLKETKKKLEDRRAGEQSLLSGHLPKMNQELLKIADELDIRPQVEQTLDDQFGGEVSQFLSSLADSLQGSIREIRGDVDIWDQQEELAAVITQMLRTYTQIRDARNTAEQLLVSGNLDQGLRLTTGPYFLSGSGADDQSSAEHWNGYPAQTRESMLQTLIDIKLDHDVEPVHLNLDEGAFDKQILDQLVRHDTFREMWKHVFSVVPELDIPGYLGSDAARQGSANEADTPSDQDRALERFKFHEQRVAELLDVFRAHYGLAQQDELTPLRELRDQAVQISSEICADATAATTGLSNIDSTELAAQEPFAEFEKSLQEAVKLAKQLESMERLLADDHAAAEELAVSIGDENALAAERRTTVCQVAEAMETCNNNTERDQFYAQAAAAHAEIKPAFGRARKHYSGLEGIGGKGKEALDQLTKAQQLAHEIDDVPEEISNAAKDVRQWIESADSLLHATAEEKTAQLLEIDNRAGDLALQAEKKLQARKGTERGDALLAELPQLLDQISATFKSANACLEEPRQTFATAKNKAEKFQSRYTALKIDVSRVHKSFLPDEDGSANPVFASALEKANLIDLLFSMGKGYMESCTQHLLLAKVCMNNVDTLKLVDFSTTMPNVVGMSCNDGRVTLAANNIPYQTVSAGKAPHPDWEYRVDATFPAAGEEASLVGDVAILSCYEELDIPAYLATIDCSTLPGSVAVYDPAQRIGVCDCIDGDVFNPSHSRCINCDSYYQGAADAFNAGDLDTAQAWVNEAAACSWAGGVQAQIEKERHRRICAHISNELHAAVHSRNAPAANGLLNKANQQSCQMNSGLRQNAVNLINAYNQAVAQRRDEQRQRDRENMSAVMNMILEGVREVQQSSSTSSGTRRSSASSSHSSSSSSSNSTGSGSRSTSSDDDGINLLNVRAGAAESSQ